MKKIVVTQDVGMTDNQKQRLSSLGNVVFFDTIPASREEWLDRVQGADIIYSEESRMHESLPYIHNCFLTFPFTAFLKEVNIEQLKQNNVVSASAKGGNKYAVAEWNLMALLNLTRHTAEILQSTKKLGWDFLSSIKGLHDLDVLILGTGNIGSVTGELCQSLGMNVDFYTRGDDLSSKINGKQVIINCLRLNEETTGLINANSLLGFRGYYISSAGHEIDNQHEIIELIKSNTLKGYARDGTHEMAGADAGNMDYQYLQKTLAGYNVFITPAIAWSTTHAIRYSNDVCIENIKQYIQGAPINLLY